MSANMVDPFAADSDYRPPADGVSQYTKLEQGTTDLRILSSAVIGYLWWEADGEKRRPVRVRERADVPKERLASKDYTIRAAHFWAFVVWNHTASALQVCEITQRTVQAALMSISRNPRWGHPCKPAHPYDVSITKSGEGKDTEYSVIAAPAMPLPDGTEELAQKVNLNALYSGDDPFEGVDTSTIVGQPKPKDDDVPF